MFINIRDDEIEHTKTMAACQDGSIGLDFQVSQVSNGSVLMATAAALLCLLLWLLHPCLMAATVPAEYWVPCIPLAPVAELS